MLGKKIPTFLALLVLIAIGVGIFLWQKTGVSTNTAEIVPVGVKITNLSDSKFSVSWTTKTAVSGAVEYGSVGGKLDKKATDDRGETHIGLTHHVTISGLQPGTNYAFRILSSAAEKRFDNNGNVYSATTGSQLTQIPAARSLYGEVTGGSEDTIVYVAMPNAQAASVTLTSTGSYSVPISTLRSTDMSSYVSYDPSATIISLVIDNGTKKSQVSVSTANISPVPTTILGQDADYRVVGKESPQIAQVEPTSAPNVTEETAITPTIFNVDPLQGADINAVTTYKYTLTYPSTEGEVITTTKPEFAGTGEPNADIDIALSGQKVVTDKVRLDASGNWSWSPAIALAIGKQKIVITYTDNNDQTKTIERGFSISNATVTSEPAFVASESANTNNATVSATPSPRVTIPATESGVPVTGAIAPTLLTGAIGFVIMVAGALIMAF